MLGQDGNDLTIVNNGDGSDFLEGGDGTDTVQVNGANGAGDDISISPNGNRIRVQRNGPQKLDSALSEIFVGFQATSVRVT